jgi:hypothetical protein
MGDILVLYPVYLKRPVVSNARQENFTFLNVLQKQPPVKMGDNEWATTLQSPLALHTYRNILMLKELNLLPEACWFLAWLSL